ncbi:MAG TPA: transglutaminase-like domain-containing protein [Candidatus Acidoferrales bacterium]|nr:transglutaminase-like domain-containing protein [Candidatus Acidoferrales bacterium]
MLDEHKRKYAAFAAAVCLPDEEIDLGRAALVIAQGEYPELSIGRYLERLDAMAGEVRRRAGENADPLRLIATLNFVLFTREGLRGNAVDYYDPRNSFLNDVLERKRGIPISLSVIYIEVARRAGLNLCGVNFPGHFLVKHAGPEEEIVIDPFHRGAILSAEDLQLRLDQLYGGNVPLDQGFLIAASKKQILVRMLSNLKSIYLQQEDFERTLSVVERLLILEPLAAQNIRDRGLLYLKQECFLQAKADLERYLKLAPDAADAADIREYLLSTLKLQFH